MKNVKKCCMAAAAVVMGILLLLAAGNAVSERYGQWQREHSGVPDAVSSICTGGTCRLTVVANCSRIEDGDAFAAEVVRMYHENSFHTIRFSTDVEEPEILDITVYLKRGDIGNSEPVMRIWFEADENELEYDFVQGGRGDGK